MIACASVAGRRFAGAGTMDDLLAEFLSETVDMLDLVDDALARFEQQPSDQAALNAIFRLMHTIKGTGGFLGLRRLPALAHACETLLDEVREGNLPVTPETLALILRSIDRIRAMTANLAATGREPDEDDGMMIEALYAAVEGEACRLVAPKAQRIYGANGAQDAPHQAPASAHATEAPARAEESRLSPAQAGIAMTAPFKEHGLKGGRAPSTLTVRVSIAQLDQIMAMASKLALTHDQLVRASRVFELSALKAPLQDLAHITAELQATVKQARMQSFGSASRRLKRLVRNVAFDLGKSIELRLEGEDLELDRSVLDHLMAPLVHMVRNACDHGIESPGERLAKGKPAQGVLRLSATQEDGHIIIEIADDGAGLNTTQIRRKAAEKGLMTDAEASALPEALAHRLIFVPGFSTADHVTTLSGRGVGMDVVRAQIDALGGDVALTSIDGQGASFRIMIPATPPIHKASMKDGTGLILVRAGDAALMGVPLALATGVTQTSTAALKRVNGQVLAAYDGALMRLTHLGGDSAFRAEGVQPVLVFEGEHGRVGLAVDEVLDIVTEPLSIDLSSARLGILGTVAIDGDLVDIVDLNHYLHSARHACADQKPASPGSKGRILLVDHNHFTRALLTPLLEEAGYNAVHATEFSEALRLKDAGEIFDAILADIDADPAGADAFAAQLEQDPAWRDAARLGLTQGASPVGAFADAVRKTDQEGLLAALDGAIQSKERAA